MAQSRAWEAQDEGTRFGARWGLVLSHPRASLLCPYIMDYTSKLLVPLPENNSAHWWEWSPQDGITFRRLYLSSEEVKNRLQCMLRGPLTSDDSQYGPLLLQITKDTNQRLTSLPPFIKPGVPGFTPKTDTGQSRIRRAPCLMSPPMISSWSSSWLLKGSDCISHFMETQAESWKSTS